MISNRFQGICDLFRRSWKGHSSGKSYVNFCGSQQPGLVPPVFFVVVVVAAAAAVVTMSLH